MAHESEPGPIPLRAIHLDIEQRSISFESDHSVTRLTLTKAGLLYQVLGASSLADRAVERLIDEASPSGEKRESTVTISGRLKTQPKEGRPDKSGKPTAWAKLAAHEEGQETAHMYSVTFHRHTARIALSLEQEAQVTVQGYVRESRDPKRMDALSVFNLLSYPGKPVKPSE